MLISAFAVAAPAITAQASPGPFVCAPGFYQVIAGQLNQLDPVTGSYTPIGPVQPAYNAMGYDPMDNFLYALSTDASNRGDLLRIANDGSISDLGLPFGLPAANYVAGAFDDVGNLWVRSTATTWYAIDPMTLIADTVAITGAADAGNDLVWMGGFAYLLQGAAPTTLYRVNTFTGVATSATVTGITGAGGSFGAAWTDNPNDLFFSDNSTGKIFLINGFATSSPTGSLLVDGQTASTNDGASCKLAANPFEAPIANDDAYTTLINTPLTVSAGAGVLTNDIGAGISETSFTAAGAGTAVVQSDGSFTYSPASGDTGVDTFTYTITDAFNRTSTATVTISVNLPPPPVAIDDFYTTTAGAALNQGAIGGVLSNDSGTGIIVTTNTSPAYGTLVLNGNNGSFVYTPHVGSSGSDNFGYTINDSYGRQSSAIVTFTVNPVAENVVGSGTGPSALTVTPSTPLGLGPFTYALTSHPPNADGSASMNAATGVITFAPAAGFSGAVPTFEYAVFDVSADLSAPATIDLTVNEPAAPAASNDGYTTTVNTAINQLAAGGLLSNDTGTALTVTSNTTPAHGAVAITTTGSFVYTPATGYSGSDSFDYTATDVYDRTSVATVTITVDVGLPAPPSAHDISGTTNADAAVTLTPSTPSGAGPFTYALASSPSASDGVATINSATGAVTFTPAHGFSGIVPSFTYTVTDVDDQVSAPADVSVNVTPLVAPASGTGTPGAPIVVQPPAPVGTGPFTYALVPGSLPPAGDGTVSINATTGALVFTPAPGFTGRATVSYTVTDADGLTSSAAVVTFDVAGIATVPSTGAVETPMVAGMLLLVLGLLLVAGVVARRTRLFGATLQPRR